MNTAEILKRKWPIAGIAAGGVVLAVLVWLSLKPAGLGPGFVSGNGRIEATEIDVAAKLGGRVQNIMVNEGDFVVLGQPLAQMQVSVLEAQRDVARAQVLQAGTAVASAEAQVLARKSEKAAAQAMQGLRSSELDAIQRRFERTETLTQQGAAPVQELDDSRAKLQGGEAARHRGARLSARS